MECDLFGHPIVVPVVRPQGRPRHRPTAALRRRARRLLAKGLTRPEIAKALGVSPPTLLLYYAAELESRSQTGRRRAQRDAAKGGNHAR